MGLIDRARLNAQALILSRMILTIFNAAFEGYWQDRNARRANFANNLAEWLVAMAVRVETNNHRRTVPVARIARMLGMPRSTVTRWATRLREHGTVLQVDGMDGYTSDETYVDGRAPFFDRMVTAVLVAADELRALH